MMEKVDTQDREEIVFSVTLPGRAHETHTVWGELRSPPGAAARPLLILLSGGTYDHHYWNLPGTPGGSSFVEAARRAGFATLNIDRPGLGRSSRPAADLLTLGSEADVVHQIVDAFRTGCQSAAGFGRIVLVGHSLGSAIAVQESVTYGDVDGLVLTGFTHSGGPAVLEVIASQVEASSLPDARFRDAPAGYLTTAPGARSLFYNMADADLQNVARDEETRSTMTDSGNLGLAALLGDPAVTNALTVPVITVIGAEDRLFNTPGDRTVAERESSYFGGSSSYATIVIPGAGHSLALSKSAPASNASILEWVGTQFEERPTEATFIMAR